MDRSPRGMDYGVRKTLLRMRVSETPECVDAVLKAQEGRDFRNQEVNGTWESQGGQEGILTTWMGDGGPSMVGRCHWAMNIRSFLMPPI